MRILIDGLDLSGKSTLAARLTTALEERNLRPIHHRGFLAPHNPLTSPLDTVKAPDHPMSALLNTSYLAGCVLDKALGGARGWERRGLLVQESYVDRCLAYGYASGPWPAARLALRTPGMFVGFDLAVYLGAPLHVRRERLSRRVGANSIDRLSVLSEKFHDDFMTALAMAGRRHRRVLTFDTSRHSTELITEQITEHVTQLLSDGKGSRGGDREKHRKEAFR
ncbi:hypothetical protein ACICHK_41685 (plasmid) [Streptomyces sp. AHU1]|uniref:hypothetical protein n=1 Tax=Streptomyces sp. AHU1 TaxID=3377215 RepID=UPI0038784225